MPFLELSLALKLRVILPLVGHIHLEGSLTSPDMEGRGGLLFVLAWGVFRAVVVVGGWLLTLLLAGGGGAGWLADLAGAGWFPGFAADGVFGLGGVSRNS